MIKVFVTDLDLMTKAQKELNEIYTVSDWSYKYKKQMRLGGHTRFHQTKRELISELFLIKAVGDTIIIYGELDDEVRNALADFGFGNKIQCNNYIIFQITDYR